MMVSPSTILLTSSALAALLAAAAAEATPAACHAQLVDLGTFGGASSQAVAMNNHGTVVGSALTTGGAQHAFVAMPDQPLRDLSSGLPEPALSSQATAIDDAGNLAGINGASAWIWAASAPTASGIEPPALGYPCIHEFSIVSVDRIARDGTLVGRASRCLTTAQDLMAILPAADGEQRQPTLLESQLSDTVFGGHAPAIDRRGDVAFTPVTFRWNNCTVARGQPRQRSAGYRTARPLNVTNDKRPCAMAADTTEDGRVIGYSYAADAMGTIPAHFHRGFVHDPRGQLTQTLSSPQARFGATWALGTSPDGQHLAGASAATADTQASQHAAATRFDRDPATGQYIGLVLPLGGGDAGRPTWALAVNGAGQVLGKAARTVETSDYFVQRGTTAAIWLGQRFPNLTDVTMMMQNERGQLAGTGRINGLPRAFRIDCPLGD